MSYLTEEQSEFSGRPVELYQFTMDGVITRYTDANIAVFANGFNWTPDQISREDIEQAQEINRNDMQINVSQQFPIARAFLGPLVRTPVGLVIYRTYRNDAEVKAVWQGSVRSASAKDEDAVMFAETILSSITREGLNRSYSHTCNNFLYDPMCGLNPENFGVDGTVIAISTDKTVLTLSNASYGFDYFTAGFIKRNANNDLRFITAHDGGSLVTLLTPFIGLVVGESVRFYKGCKRTVDACKTFTNGNISTNPSGTNIENFGGTPYVPTDNVFETGLK